MSKTNPQPKYRLPLRILAVHNDFNNLSKDERVLVSDILRHLADGKEIDELFNAKSPSHRPNSPSVDQRVWDVCIAMAPSSMGGMGMTRAQAIRYVAEIHRIDEDALKENLKSKRGKAIFSRSSIDLNNINQGD